MAREPSEGEFTKRHETTRRARDDAFGRLLGDDWVAVEPGIYHQVDRSAQRTEGAQGSSGDSLDESLMDALPNEECRDAGDGPAEEDDWEPTVAPRSRRRSWWRR